MEMSSSSPTPEPTPGYTLALPPDALLYKAHTVAIEQWPPISNKVEHPAPSTIDVEAAPATESPPTPRRTTPLAAIAEEKLDDVALDLSLRLKATTIDGGDDAARKRLDTAPPADVVGTPLPVFGPPPPPPPAGKRAPVTPNPADNKRNFSIYIPYDPNTKLFPTDGEPDTDKLRTRRKDVWSRLDAASTMGCTPREAWDRAFAFEDRDTVTERRIRGVLAVIENIATRSVLARVTEREPRVALGARVEKVIRSLGSAGIWAYVQRSVTGGGIPAFICVPPGVNLSGAPPKQKPTPNRNVAQTEMRLTDLHDLVVKTLRMPLSIVISTRGEDRVRHLLHRVQMRRVDAYDYAGHAGAMRSSASDRLGHCPCTYVALHDADTEEDPVHAAAAAVTAVWVVLQRTVDAKGTPIPDWLLREKPGTLAKDTDADISGMSLEFLCVRPRCTHRDGSVTGSTALDLPHTFVRCGEDVSDAVQRLIRDTIPGGKDAFKTIASMAALDAHKIKGAVPPQPDQVQMPISLLHVEYRNDSPIHGFNTTHLAYEIAVQDTTRDLMFNAARRDPQAELYRFAITPAAPGAQFMPPSCLWYPAAVEDASASTGSSQSLTGMTNQLMRFVIAQYGAAAQRAMEKQQRPPTKKVRIASDGDTAAPEDDVKSTPPPAATPVVDDPPHWMCITALDRKANPKGAQFLIKLVWTSEAPPPHNGVPFIRAPTSILGEGHRPDLYEVMGAWRDAAMLDKRLTPITGGHTTVEYRVDASDPRVAASPNFPHEAIDPKQLAHSLGVPENTPCVTEPTRVQDDDVKTGDASVPAAVRAAIDSTSTDVLERTRAAMTEALNARRAPAAAADDVKTGEERVPVEVLAAIAKASPETLKATVGVLNLIKETHPDAILGEIIDTMNVRADTTPGAAPPSKAVGEGDDTLKQV